MTKKQVRKKFKTLQKDSRVIENKLLNKILNSNDFDMEKYENNYGLPKAIMNIINSILIVYWGPRANQDKVSEKIKEWLKL